MHQHASTRRSVHGQSFLVTLTVTNTGGAAANGLTAAAWLLDGGGAATGAGRIPPCGGARGGASRTFTWTFTGSAAGPLTFSTTVTATDANSAAALAAGPLAAGR